MYVEHIIFRLIKLSYALHPIVYVNNLVLLSPENLWALQRRVDLAPNHNNMLQMQFILNISIAADAMVEQTVSFQ